ncbi:MULTISPECIES: NADH-quinone oxidoreductase subunit M [unclassified Pseudactinotalea]|uniref:NADH-quinone oxidoreductase subunit M n=1 Tax=Micrococcales TaxID=85006 RepID=UPI003C7A7126
MFGLEDFPWLTAMIAVPAVAGVAVWLLKPLRRIARPIGLVVSLAVLGGGVVMATGFDVGSADQVQMSTTASWIPALGISYDVGVNGMGLSLVLLAALLVPIVLVAAWNEVRAPERVAVTTSGGDSVEATGDAVDTEALESRQATFVGLILILLALMVLVFAARDLFLFYLAFEAMLIPVYFLIGVFGGPDRRAAAVKFLIYSLAGGLIMLAGLVVVFAQTWGDAEGMRMDNLSDVFADNPTMGMWVFLSFFVAFAVKAPMVPVHTWLPDSAAQATPGTSTLLVGVLDKVGTFGMIAILLPIFPGAAAQAAPVIMVLAVISIIYGALLALGQNDLMRMIAFTSVSHFGFIVLGIFAGTQTAMVGSMLYMLAHGLSTAAMFLIAGFLIQRGYSADMRTYSGMQRVTPVLAGTFLFAGLSTLALPGLSGFIPEYLVLIGSYEAHPAWGAAAVIGVVLAALYILMAYQRVFTGPIPGPPAGRTLGLPARAGLSDLVAREKWLLVPLGLAIVFLGVYPAPVLDLLSGVADSFASILGSA